MKENTYITKSTIPTESFVQSWFVKWCWMSRAKYPALRLAFAVPNGAWTMNKAMAVKLKREGLRVGVPDWILPVRTQFYAGLAIEFKRSPGVKLSNQQAEYHELMRSHGWSVHVCTTWQSAAAVVEEYLK